MLLAGKFVSEIAKFDLKMMHLFDPLIRIRFGEILQPFGNQYLRFEFATGSQRNIEKVNQLGVSSPATALCNISGNGDRCFFHLG